MVVAAVAGTIAYACADGGVGPGSWDPQQSSAILSPANDTRQNLLLLMADRYGTPTADPQAMAKGIVPIEFPWKVMKARLSPPAEDGAPAATASWDSTAFTRCHSNASGSAQFVAAVRAAAGIPAGEKQLLVAAREAFRPSCEAARAAPYRPDGLSTPAALEFGAYLSGADLFYRGDFEAAQRQFGSLSGASSPWLRETALYMIARSELNRAQVSAFDEYGSLVEPKDRDRQAIAEAGEAFAAYLQAYPSGRYAPSARGLLRRVAWLADDRQALGSAYSSLVGSPAAKDGGGANIGLIDEIDIKLLPPGDGSGVTDPTLLAVVDLMRLRQDGRGESDWSYRGKKLERAELEAQRPLFRSDPALFEYLLAVEAFYGRKQPKEVLTLIPDAAHQQRFSYVQFSRQMLRGFALEALQDRNARGFWLSMIPGAVQPYQREAVELALAQHDAKANTPERLFTSGTPLRSPLIRQRILEEHAGPALLRQQARAGVTAHEREVSLYLLLAGELHHGLYTDFLRDSEMVGAPRGPVEGDYPGAWSVQDYDPLYNDGLGRPPLYLFAVGGSDDLAPCPDIRATAAQLSADPTAIRPRLCLAEFIRRKGFDGWSETYDPQYDVVNRPRGFAGKPLERINIYREVIGSAAASADDKAFALNRAVRCFAPAGYSSCGGGDVSVAQRKAWFERLKRDYAQSPWARDLKVYW
ncbi:MAG TPA: hypothetical protein VGD23_08035 [Sphingomicrobium sp.]